MKLAFERFGKRSADVAVVFIHGHTSSKESWAPIKTKFPVYDCLALDLRGHGNSPLSPLEENDYSIASCVNDVYELLKEQVEPSKRVFLVGHSMGSRIAVPYAASHPEGIAGVVIEDMDFMRRKSGDATNISLERTEELKQFTRQFDSLAECEAALLKFDFQQSYIDRWKTTGRIREHEGGYWCAIHPWVSHNCLVQILGTDGTPDIRKLAKHKEIPVLLMRATNGSAASDYGVQKMKSIVPRMKMQTMEGSGHSIHRTNTDEFVETLNQFIQQ